MNKLRFILTFLIWSTSVIFILLDIEDKTMSMKNWFELTIFGITTELLINKK